MLFLVTLPHCCIVRPTGQYEEMKKIKEDLEEELNKERSAHRHYKRECAALKDEYNNLRLKVRYLFEAPLMCTYLSSVSYETISY